MDIFSNREIAIAIWVSMLIGWGVTKPSIRHAFGNVARAFCKKLIFIPLVLMGAYVSLVVYGLSRIGLWEVAHLKNTVFWSVSVATVSLFQVAKVTDKPHRFRNHIKAHFELVAILELVVAIYSFSLFAELVIVPIATLLVAMQAIAERDAKLLVVSNLVNGILFAFGGFLIFYVAYKLIVDFHGIANEETLADFYLPPLLTALYLPFLFAFATYAEYENVFSRMRFSIKDPSLRRYAKRRAVCVFHLRFHLLKRWTRNVMLHHPITRDDISASMKEITELSEREANPPEVSFADGWSPYKASKFLSEVGVEMGDYHRIHDEGEGWWASSSYLKFGDNILANCIAYYIDGTDLAATVLKLVLDINEPNKEAEARRGFVDASRILFLQALQHEMPESLERALYSSRQFSAWHFGKEVIISREDWTHSSLGGYTVKFVIRNPDAQGIAGSI